MPRVKVGSEYVNFPDSMSEDQISAYLKKDIDRAAKLAQLLEKFTRDDDPVAPIGKKLQSAQDRILNAIQKIDTSVDLSPIIQAVQDGLSSIPETDVESLRKDVANEIATLREEIQNIRFPIRLDNVERDDNDQIISADFTYE